MHEKACACFEQAVDEEQGLRSDTGMNLDKQTQR